jgi:lipopolysaccharide export system permease protein
VAHVLDSAQAGERDMKTIRRLIYTEVLWSVGFISLGFLGLFSFFDLVEELKSVKTVGPEALASAYRLSHALSVTALLMPSRLYELLPICVLIGTVLVMARLAKSSEFTILRTGGLGPRRALKSLSLLGLVFVFFTFVLGDYVAPAAERTARLIKGLRTGQISAGQSGTWLKEKQTYHSYAVNIAALTPAGSMQGVRVFEFDSRGALVSLTQAPSARFGQDEAWILENAERSEFPARDAPKMDIQKLKVKEFRWPTAMSLEMVSVALLKPERMNALDLFRYIQHLEANGQTAQRYEIEFWRKVFYPLSCLVMVVLALPFAYLHFRADGIAGSVFGGVMIGISFFLLNNVFGYMGNINNWWPWLTSAAPSLLYSLGALGAFTWFVLRR